jgi:hypothetical protein
MGTPGPPLCWRRRRLQETQKRELALVTNRTEKRKWYVKQKCPSSEMNGGILIGDNGPRQTNTARTRTGQNPVRDRKL